MVCMVEALIIWLDNYYFLTIQLIISPYNMFWGRYCDFSSSK